MSIIDVTGFDNKSLSNKCFNTFIDQRYFEMDIIYFVVDITKGLETNEEKQLLDLIVERVKKAHKLHYINYDFNYCKKAPRVIVIVNKCDNMYYNEKENKYTLGEQHGTIFQRIQTTILNKFENEGIRKYLLDVIPFCAKNAYLFVKLRVCNNDKLFTKEEFDQIGLMLAFAEYNNLRSNEKEKLKFLINLVQNKTVTTTHNEGMKLINLIINNSGYNTLKSVLKQFMPNQTYIDKYNNFNDLYSSDDISKMELQLLVNTKQFTKFYSMAINSMAINSIQCIDWTFVESDEFEKKYSIKENDNSIIHKFKVTNNKECYHITINEPIIKSYCLIINMIATNIKNVNNKLDTPNSAVFLWFIKEEMNSLAGYILELLTRHEDCYVMLLNYYNIKLQLDKFFPSQLIFLENSTELFDVVKNSITNTIGNDATLKVTSKYLLEVFKLLDKLNLLTCDVVETMKNAILQRYKLMVYLHVNLNVPANTRYSSQVVNFNPKNYRCQRTDIYPAAVVHDYLNDHIVDKDFIELLQNSIDKCKQDPETAAEIAELKELKQQTQKVIDDIHVKIHDVNKEINSVNSENLANLEQRRSNYNTMLLKKTGELSGIWEKIQDLSCRNTVNSVNSEKYIHTKKYMRSLMYLLCTIRTARNMQCQIIHLYDTSKESIQNDMELWGCIELESGKTHQDGMLLKTHDTNYVLTGKVMINTYEIHTYVIIDYQKFAENLPRITNAVALDSYIVALFTYYREKYPEDRNYTSIDCANAYIAKMKLNDAKPCNYDANVQTKKVENIHLVSHNNAKAEDIATKIVDILENNK